MQSILKKNFGPPKLSTTAGVEGGAERSIVFGVTSWIYSQDMDVTICRRVAGVLVRVRRRLSWLRGVSRILVLFVCVRVVACHIPSA